MRQKICVKIIELVPYYIASIFTCFCIISILLLLFDKFSTFWIIFINFPIQLLFLFLITKYIKVTRPGGIKEKVIIDIIAIIFAIAWGSFNFFYTTQHVFTDRDPGTYTIGAIHLTHNNSILFHPSNVLVGYNKTTSSSAGFVSEDEGPNSITYAQGTHALPAIAGFVGRFSGIKALMHINPIIGALAMLVFYGLARLFVRPSLAFLSIFILSFCLPFIFVSRDMYTEPLALLFLAGSLIFVNEALVRDRRILWLLAGLVTGAGMLVRIDALLQIAAIIVFCSLYILVSKDKTKLTWSVKNCLLFLFPTAAIALLGLADVRFLSPYYFKEHKPLILQEGLILLVSVVLLIVSSIVNKKDFVKKLDKMTSWRGILSVLLILFMGLFLISRPIWMASYQKNDNPVVAYIQMNKDDKLEANRLYSEYSYEWIEWYLGTTLVLFALLGLAFSTNQILSSRNNIRLAPLVIVFLVTASVYLIRPSITPDQLWATRRFTPVVYPLTILFAVILISLILNNQYYKNINHKLRIGLIIFIIGIFILPTLVVTKTFIRTRELARLKTINDICASIPKNSVVIWSAQARLELIEPTKEICGQESIGLIEKADSTILGKLAKDITREGKVPIFGYYTSQKDSSVDKNLIIYSTKNISNSYNKIDQTLTTYPQKTIKATDSVELGLITFDGSLTNLK